MANTLREKPREATHWSSRMMAKATGLSQTAVMRIWNAFELQPHRTEAFRLSTDPLFIETVGDIVGRYQIQALDRAQPILRMMPGVPERHRLQPQWNHDPVRGTEHRYQQGDR